MNQNEKNETETEIEKENEIKEIIEKEKDYIPLIILKYIIFILINSL